ncbi:M48 family metallopeptidase [Thiomonas sp. FB-Cd]|uniref:M48 family metallopeptidase n=1 Tax=Thiomonas sp. FB-Cd TaxID=1158292 RepID=UPI0009E09F40|nr:SprT family zinc-dependent metalloprotease [Thiomonas sp. FB-Cd]
MTDKTEPLRQLSLFDGVDLFIPTLEPAQPHLLDIATAQPTEPRPVAIRPDDRGPSAIEPAPPPLRRYDDGTHRFDYVLRRASRRSIGIRIDDQGIVVSAPRWVGMGQVQAMLADKASWVVRQHGLREQRRHAQQAARIDWRDGGRLPYLGRSLTLRLGAEGGDPALSACGSDLCLPLPADAAAQRVRDTVQAWMQREAITLFQQRAIHFATRLGVEVQAIKLTSASTRWGSATACGVLRLHWRLLHFSPAIVDYVVAHEVAHLREMNHSARFWQTVDDLFPTWREARSALRHSLLPPW